MAFVVVVFDVVAVVPVALLLVEVRVAVPALTVFHVAVASRSMVLTLASDPARAVDQVVDQIAKAEVQKARLARPFNPERHRVDSATLIGGGTGSSTGHEAPTVVVLPGGSGVAEGAIHVDFDNVVVRAIEEIDCELHGVGPVDAYGRDLDVCESVLRATAGPGSQGISVLSSQPVVLVVAEPYFRARRVRLQPDVAH